MGDGLRACGTPSRTSTPPANRSLDDVIKMAESGEYRQNRLFKAAENSAENREKIDRIVIRKVAESWQKFHSLSIRPNEEVL